MENIPTHNTEKKKRTFVYTDNTDGEKILFEYEGVDILEADEAFEKATGLNAAKTPHIGCQVIKKEL